MHEVSKPAHQRPTLGVIIRFKNSATTLPGVIEALRRQTVQPNLILGVNNQSTDNSSDLLLAAGAEVIEWTHPYHHARVLNFAVSHCPTDLVLVLSSHTVLESRDAVERLVEAMTHPRTACVSAKWDDDPFYSDAIVWEEMRAKGLKFASVYSNSMGMLRRSLWEEIPFDESLVTMEDSAWALEQLRHGYTVKRLNLRFDYVRSGKDRVFAFAFLTFKLAARHGLRVTWLGPRRSAMALLQAWAERFLPHDGADSAKGNWRLHLQRLWAFLSWRWRPLPTCE